MKINAYMSIFLISIVLTSCTQRQVQSSCDIKELLLDQSDFPDGTILDQVSSPVAEYPTESAGFTASFQQDLMYQVVGRYSSARQAEKKFTENLGYYFKGDNYEGPWQTPSELSYESSLAQQYHVACGNISQQGDQCRMIGQYNDHYVFFFAYISESGITLETFEDLLVKLDGHMAQCSE